VDGCSGAYIAKDGSVKRYEVRSAAAFGAAPSPTSIFTTIVNAPLESEGIFIILLLYDFTI
jgi:hypothetical protein